VTVHPFDVPGAPEEDGAGNPGRRLREARGAARLTQDDVALRLRLDRRVVDALERDDYRDLPEPTFVRGYLRGYARLLGLPPGPIVEAYDRQGHAPPGLVPDIASRPQVRSTDVPVRIVTYAIVGVLITLGVLWWRFERAPEPVPLDLAGLATAPATAGEPASPPARRPEPSVAPPPASASAAHPAPATPSPATAAVAARAADAPAPGRLPPAPAAAVPTAPPATPVPTVAVASASPGQAAQVPTVGPTTPAAGPDRLVLRLKHDSWVEVYERGGKRLFFNQAKAGQTLSLSGSPPFRVILGYARDAQVEYNGALFDTAPHTSRDIARFSVGG
jgi:cytoskeleton protein RodZ